jgi:AmiR/NasT family two-component response regulator
MVDAEERSTQSGSGADREEVEQLRRALGSSREIGVAIGIVMVTYGMGHDAAVAWLKRQSNETNVKLSALCAELVREASQPPPN